MTVKQVLEQAAQAALETMFFVESGVAEPGSFPAIPVIAEVAFHACHGDGRERAGLFSLVVTEECAQSMAASFAGTGEGEGVARRKVREVVTELANIICGSALTRLDPHGRFTLQSPTITENFFEPGPDAEVTECWLSVPDAGGVLRLALAWDALPSAESAGSA